MPLAFAPPQFVQTRECRLASEEVSPPEPHGTVLLQCGIHDGVGHIPEVELDERFDVEAIEFPA